MQSLEFGKMLTRQNITDIGSSEEAPSGKETYHHRRLPTKHSIAISFFAILYSFYLVRQEKLLC